MFHCDEDDAVDAHLIAECTLLVEEVGIIRLFSYADCESEVTQLKMRSCASCVCVWGGGGGERGGARKGADIRKEQLGDSTYPGWRRRRFHRLPSLQKWMGRRTLG